MTLTRRKRIQLVLDPPLFEGVQYRASSHDISLSLAARDLIKEALEWEATLEVYRSPELLKNLKAGLEAERRGDIIREK